MKENLLVLLNFLYKIKVNKYKLILMNSLYNQIKMLKLKLFLNLHYQEYFKLL